MTPEEVRQIVIDEIKNKLKVWVTTDTSYSYDTSYVKINVRLELDNQIISEHDDSVSI